jgi:hypothetical protein
MPPGQSGPLFRSFLGAFPGTLEDMLLLLRVLLAPLLILAGSLAQRRWGQAVGGRLISLPLTSLPLLLLLSLSDGPGFAASAARAALAAGVAQSAWCLAYAVAAHRHRPATAVLVATAIFALVCVVLDRFPVAPVVGASLAAASILAALRWWPATGPDGGPPRPSRSDLPVRMAVAAAFTLGLTESAASLGARPAGLVGALPLLTVVLAFATHRRDGAGATNRFLHGVMAGSFSVVAALLVLALALGRLPLALTMVLAIAAAVVAQGIPTPPSRRPAAGGQASPARMARARW